MKGWHENPDETGKAPEHRDVALKKMAGEANNVPMVKEPENLLMVTTRENGMIFETGKPVSFSFIRNTKKAPKNPDKTRFGQDIEPHGRYLLLKPESYKYTEGWETGTVTFMNPLVIEWITTSSYPTGWKSRLSRHFGRKTGRRLSNAIISAGYDGIITVDNNHVSEIVALIDSKKRSAPTAEEATSAEEYADSQINAYHQSQSSEPIEEFKRARGYG